MTSLFLSLRESINVVIMIGSSRLRSHYVIPENQIQKSEGQVAYMVNSLLRNSVRSGAYEEPSSCRSGSTLILRNIIACSPSRECGCAPQVYIFVLSLSSSLVFLWLGAF
jgi:hypothetical protein